MITLRPFREDELGYFDVVDPTVDPYNFFGFRLSVGRRLERWREHGLVEHLDGGALVVDLADVSNIAEQRALVKAGFTREGVQRGAQFRGGRYRDLVQYSRLRDDNPDANT